MLHLLVPKKKSLHIIKVLIFFLSDPALTFHQRNICLQMPSFSRSTTKVRPENFTVCKAHERPIKPYSHIISALVGLFWGVFSKNSICPKMPKLNLKTLKLNLKIENLSHITNFRPVIKVYSPKHANLN